MKRIFCDIFLIASLVFSPWYVYVPFAVFFSFLFCNYWEVVVFGLFIDSVYGAGAVGLYGGRISFTVALALFALFFDKIRGELRFSLA